MKRYALVLIGMMLAGCMAGPEGEGATSEALSAAPHVDSVTLANGVELSYFAQGRAHGEVVIFLHGYTDSHHSFDRNLRIFPRRYRVYALDQRGHGDSSQPACCYTQQDFADDVVQFMDAMGIDEASLVGHSMGSFIAHHVAVSYPDRVDKLVLIGSAPTAGNDAVLDFKAYVDTLTDPIDPAFVRDFQASTFHQPIPESFLDTAVSESLRLPASLWQQILGGLVAEDHAAALPTITAPTLIFWGDQDDLFSEAEQHALNALIPNSTLTIYPDTGHGLHVERPHQFVHDLKRFLR